MQCLVFVKFLEGCSLPPDNFFSRINAKWSWLEETNEAESPETDFEGTSRLQPPRSAICIADYESIEQLAIDLAIMPGAGISQIDVVPLSDETDNAALVTSSEDTITAG
ncbi:MAG: hypothetical protein V1767_01935 [Chloroflexota bacterium]